ncbi:MAG TPA: MFS transporter [Candidatus Acidoferrales bacterium]|jgi:FSR family fosmidomycin resistance protein-like MFS transporter|nr:MFS transporter [Candidatus Acidoferrales bacterium]
MAVSQLQTFEAIEEKTAFKVLAAISLCHLVNDMLSSVLPAIYPMLKVSFHLDFAQIGLITLTYQLTASLLQPLVGMHTDKKAMPYSLSVGMGISLCGLLLLATARSFPSVLTGAAMVGMGSSVFHPESARVARMASGGQHGLAQSLFQVGGNAGLALGPLLVAFIVLPRGQKDVAWFSVAALVAIVLLANIGRWAKAHARDLKKAKVKVREAGPELPRKRVVTSVLVLMALLFSKYFYLASLTSYYTFYLISKFHVSVRSSQIYLFVFLGAVAIGTVIGGPIGDRIGRKYVIWCSILGVLPFTLALPYVNLFWTGILSVVIGLVLASAFSAIVVYAQELVPGRVGMISGLCYGFAFGVAGLGAALLGELADATSIGHVYRVCSYLPAVGLLAALLPNIEVSRQRKLKLQEAEA